MTFSMLHRYGGVGRWQVLTCGHEYKPLASWLAASRVPDLPGQVSTIEPLASLARCYRC